MDITTTDLQKLTSSSDHNTPVYIKDRNGVVHEIKRVGLERVYEIIEHVVPATLETGHETIEPKEHTETRLVIEIV